MKINPTEESNSIPPSNLVIEYKATSLIARGVLSIIAIIILLIMTDALSNILAVILLGIWLLISLMWLKKAFIDTALIITDTGIKINSKLNIGWNHIDSFYIQTIIVDGEEAERIIINSNFKNLNFVMEDLNVDKERLNRWIRYYKQSQKKI